MAVQVERVAAGIIADLREQRTRELYCQLILHSWLGRG
jgi:hypothetical protein